MAKLLASIMAAVALIAVSLPAISQVVFRDDFTLSWTMPRQGWQLVDGHFLNTATSGYADTAYPIFNGGPSYSNYSIQFDFCPTQYTPQQGAVISVMVNLSTPDNPTAQVGTTGYSIGFGYQDSYGIQRIDGYGIAQTLVGGTDTRVRMLLGHCYVVAVAAEAGSIKFKVYEKGTADPGWMYDVADGTYSCGYFGIVTFETLGWIDNVEVTAPPAKPVLFDVPADQGGVLRASWRMSGDDSPTAVNPVISYEVQRYESGWQTITTIAAAAADSYSALVETPDIAVVGQPVPYSQFRVVQRTAIPSIFYESLVDSAYSIDNLPPPKPEAMLYDSLDDRVIVWNQPDMPDFGSACVYRGEESGFVAGEPISCPSTCYFLESHLAWYFYRVQFSDIHGNLSEFSDELHGQWPTPVPGAIPNALKLYPCQPNPFNPRTTIKYDLPEAGHVQLTVFDVAGRLVRTLVDDSMPQGSHETVWDGRDATGREVGSGSYLARLEFGGKVETVRMGLVR